MKNLIIIALAIISSFSVQAQEDIMFTATRHALVETDVEIDNSGNEHRNATFAKGAFGETLQYTTKSDKSVYHQNAKRIRTTHTGFNVELTVSTNALSQNNIIFKYFGEIQVEAVANGYSYQVGGFKNEAAAQNFIANVLNNRYENAKVITFENGKRTK